MFTVWYGDNNHEFLEQTDDVQIVCHRAESMGYVVKDIVKIGG